MTAAENSPKWAQATAEDVRSVDVNAPVADVRFAEGYRYSVAYSRAAEELVKSSDAATPVNNKAYVMLASVMAMHQRSDNSKQPFGAQMVFSDGRRSALPEDFRAESVISALAEVAARAESCVIRARVSDLCWLLDRKRSQLGRTAISAYLQIVEELKAGKLVPLIGEKKSNVFCSEAHEVMSRALAISRAIGWDSNEAVATRECLNELVRIATEAKERVPLIWFCELDLRFGVSDPAHIGKTLEAILADNSTASDDLELYRLAARAYRYAKDEQSSNRCLVAASDCLVAQADFALEKQKSTMVASHFLSSAIAQLHGVPGVRDRSTALRHRLVDAQAGIRDEMHTFSQPIDLREIIEATEKAVGGLGIIDSLFYFAAMNRSPDPGKLVDEARASIEKHPLMAIFGSSHHDDEGKVVYRNDSETGGSAVRSQIAQSESFRRQVAASGQIDVVRRNISKRHYVSTDTFQSLLYYSPFVPADCVETYSRGFARFFEGDFVSALYVLTPMLENSIRYVLKNCGHDVTKFDISDQTQQDRTISAFFEQMRPELDEVFGVATTTDIDNVFLSQPGPCVRHAVAHGLLADGGASSPDAMYGCWLIFRLCLIPLFADRKSIEAELAGAQ